MNRLQVFLLVSLIGASLSCSGCWNQREPENLAHIATMGADYDTESGLFIIYVELVNPIALGGGAGNGGGSSPASEETDLLLSARGKSFFEAIRNVEIKATRELFWAHAQLIIVSENMARHGIGPLLDFLSRERQSRLFSYIVFTSDDVRKLMEMQLPLEQTKGEGAVRQIKSILSARSVIPDYVLRDIFTLLSQPGVEAFVPRIQIGREHEKQDDDAQEQSGQPQQQGAQSKEQPRVLEVAGGAALRGDRLVGWLGQDATRGWLMAQGRVFRGTLMIPCPGDQCGGYLSVEIFRSSSKIEPVLEGGNPGVNISIQVFGRITDHSGGSHTLEGDRGIAHTINRRLAEVVRRDVALALEQAMALQTDIFGFGNLFYRKMPGEWMKLKDDWETHFTRLSVNLEIEAEVSHTGLVINPLQIQ